MAPLAAIFLIVVIDILGLTLMVPLLPFYAQTYGATPATVGLLITSYAIFQFLSGPVLGAWSDRIGRKPVLLLSQIGTCAGFLLLGYADSLPLIFLARIIDGATAGNLSVAQAFISDHSPPDKRAKSFAIIGIGFGIGFLIGPAISGYLSRYGLSTPIFAAAGLSGLSILCTFFLLPKTPPQKHHLPDRKKGLALWTHYFSQPRLRGRLLQFACFCFAFGMFFSGFALFAERRFLVNGHPWGPQEVGYAFGFSGLLGILIQGGLIGKLVSRLGEEKLVITAFAGFTIGYTLLGFSNTLLMLGAAILFTTYSHAVVRPALTSLISRACSPSEQGAVLGLTQSLNSVASILTPLLAGPLIADMQLELWALTAAGFGFLGLLVDFMGVKNDLQKA